MMRSEKLQSQNGAEHSVVGTRVRVPDEKRDICSLKYFAEEPGNTYDQ
jgi:hypothetical protein